MSIVEDSINSCGFCKAEVKKTEIGWIIATDRSSLLSFGDNEDEARLALNIIKHYRINKQCFKRLR